jgi:hypothetical protein
VDAYALSSDVQKQWDNFWQGIDSGETTFVTYEEWFESYVAVIDRYCLTVVSTEQL